MLTGVIGLIALVIDAATSVSFINFGAFTAFTFVNLSVIAHWLRHRRGQPLNVLRYVVVPAIGTVVCVWLLTRLGSNAVLLGSVWVAIGVVYLAVLTRGFRTAPPEIAFAEAD